MDLNKNNLHISVIGLGYVGLPLAVEFGKKFKVIGYDINEERIIELKKGIDETEFRKPKCPIYQNFIGKSEQDPSKIKINLLKQLTGAVLWNQSINKMINDGVKEFYDPKIIQKILDNCKKLEKKFSKHKYPIMYGVINSLFFDSPTSCVLLGQRNDNQVNIASSLGDVLSKDETKWVKSLYK